MLWLKTSDQKTYMNRKICTRCSNPSTTKNSWCRSCKLSYQKEHYWKNRNHLIEKGRLYKTKNRERILAYKKKNRDENKESIREYRKRWRLKNLEKVKLKKQEYGRQYLKNPKNKLANSFRGRIKRAFDGNYKSGTWKNMLGCSIEECKIYLESKFQPGMTWENHGNYGWHLDHKKPISSFSIEDLHKAFHYTNLQPLWAIDNLRKGSKF